MTATANGKDVYSADNATGSIKISVKYEGTDLPKVYYVGSNGLEDMKAELKDGILSWTAKHFSDYVVVSGEQKILVKESDGSLEYYGTLTDAITNAGENAVITLLADIPDAVGISVPSGKKFVLDFNQHTYTLTGPGAGLNTGVERLPAFEGFHHHLQERHHPDRGGRKQHQAHHSELRGSDPGKYADLCGQPGGRRGLRAELQQR